MQYRQYRDFPSSLIALKRKFGRFQAAASDVEALLGRIEQHANGLDDEDPFRHLTPTHHGETRIRHCIKYQLSGGARLVTLRTDHFCFLLFAGTHDEVDAWLDRNSGLEFLVDARNRFITSYSTNGTSGAILVGQTGTYPHELFRRLSKEEFGDLVDGLPYRTIKDLESIRTGFPESELKQLLGELQDRRRANLIFDVFVMLGADRVEQARYAINRDHEELRTIDSVAEETFPEIINSDVLRDCAADAPVFRNLLRRFAESAPYRDWMLFMHPDQECIVNEDFEGPAKLVGVSGSGKTCVVVRRAIRLAGLYNGERILIVTLNRALASLIADLVDACAPDEIRHQIDVQPFFVLCQSLLKQLDPDGRSHIDEYAHKHREHVEEIWQEYYRCEVNNLDAAAFTPVHDSLLARGCSPEKYLREEVNWIRSAYTRRQRQTYLSAQRSGRRYNIMPHFRSAILDGTAGWEEKMDAVGVTDTLGLAQRLADDLAYLPQKYRCILVDEVQDFGNIELEIIHALVRDGENDLFLTGDAAQAVTTKYRQFAAAGIRIPKSRSRSLIRNYRNSEDVLRAAHAVLTENLSDEMIENEDLDIKDPDASSFTGTTPTLLTASDLQSEIRYALAMANGKIKQQPFSKVCITICGFTLEEMRRYGSRIGLPVLDGSSRLDAHPIFLSDLAHTKGFEFDMVCIINCSEGVIPDHQLPAEEHSREIAMLYVAMTRAKMDLCISHSGRLSSVFERCTSHFAQAPWSEYLGPADAYPELPLPERTEQFRPDVIRRPWRQMRGDQFLLSEFAIGLPLDLIEGIRELTNGPAQRKGRVDLRWTSIGTAVDSVRSSPQSAMIWGPARSKQLLLLADRLSQGNR